MRDFGEALTSDMRLELAATYALSCDLSPPQYRQLPSMIIAGIQHRYNMETRIAIGQQWQKFVPLADSIPNAISENSFGVCWNSAADCSFDYMTGVQVSSLDPLPESMTSLTIEARQYAVFAVAGHVSTIPKTLESIWKRWVPNSGLKIATSAPCFELYTPEFNPMTGMGGMEIWVPLEPLS